MSGFLLHINFLYFFFLLHIFERMVYIYIILQMVHWFYQWTRIWRISSYSWLTKLQDFLLRSTIAFSYCINAGGWHACYTTDRLRSDITGSRTHCQHHWYYSRTRLFGPYDRQPIARDGLLGPASGPVPAEDEWPKHCTAQYPARLRVLHIQEYVRTDSATSPVNSFCIDFVVCDRWRYW